MEEWNASFLAQANQANQANQGGETPRMDEPAWLTRRVYFVGLGVLLLLALVPRVWLWADQGAAWMVYPADEDEYYRGAIHILLRGDYYDTGQWLRAPLTSIWLAGLLALLGGNIPLVLLAQCGLSVATLLLLAELARTQFDSRGAGLAAAGLAAVSLPYASIASQMLSETLFIFLIAAGLLLFETARRRSMRWPWLLGGGLVWGLATLTRPISLYALPLLLLWALIQTVRTGRLRLHTPLALLLGFVLVVAPWTARNYAVHGHLVVIDTSGGTSFWLGNLREPGERELQFLWNETVPNLAERQQRALARAFANITSEPHVFLARMRNKAVTLWQFETRLFVASAPIGITLDEGSLPFALASDAQYIVLMVLAVGGLVLARRREQSLLVVGWVLYGTLLSAVSLGHPRLRLPLLIAAFIYAALPLAHPRQFVALVRGQVQGAGWRRGLLLAGLVALVLIWYARIYGPFGQSQFWLLAARLAPDAAAADAIDRAITAMPDNYLPYAARADWLRNRGDLAGALAAYEAAAARAPQNTAINLQRLDLARRLGDPAQMQAAHAAIAAVGWDNNQLYAWAWHNLPATGGAGLDGVAPAVGVLRGVSATAYDGTLPFRWTLDTARMRLQQPGAVRLKLLLRADQPTTPVTIYHQRAGQPEPTRLATLHVGPQWETFTLPLPLRPWPLAPASTAASGTHLVELHAPLHIASPEAPYPRGVALAGAWLER